jgi:hypothetical protein
MAVSAGPQNAALVRLLPRALCCAAVPKKRSATKRPSSSSAGHPGAIISAQSPFVCPVLDPGERTCLGLELEANHQRPGPPKQGSFTDVGCNLKCTPGRPALTLCLAPGSPRRPRGARAGPGMGLGCTTWGLGARVPVPPTGPPAGPFRGNGEWAAWAWAWAWAVGRGGGQSR